MNYAKKLKAVLDRNPTVNVSLSMNGGMHHDDWYIAIDGESRRAKKVKALENMLELGYRRLCINAIIVKGLNEGLVQEFYDKALFRGFIAQLRKIGYLSPNQDNKLVFDKRLKQISTDAKFILGEAIRQEIDRQTPVAEQGDQ